MPRQFQNILSPRHLHSSASFLYYYDSSLLLVYFLAEAQIKPLIRACYLVLFGSQTLFWRSFTQKMVRAIPAEAQATVPDNIKISDMPQFNRDDKKITFTAWRMQAKRMLAFSNIPVERQSCFRGGAGKKVGGKAKRTLAQNNVKRSDIAPYDRNDKKTTWQGWKM